MPVRLIALKVADLTILQLSCLYEAAKMQEAIAPVAAASVGVAIPNKIIPVTIKIINPTGRIWRTVAVSFSDNEI
jgi:hypothetical protein